MLSEAHPARKSSAADGKFRGTGEKSCRRKELRSRVTFFHSFIYHPADDIIDDRRSPWTLHRRATMFYRRRALSREHGALSPSSNLNVKFYCLPQYIRRTWTILILGFSYTAASGPLTTSSMSRKSRITPSNVGRIRNYKSRIPWEIILNLQSLVIQNSSISPS